MPPIICDGLFEPEKSPRLLWSSEELDNYTLLNRGGLKDLEGDDVFCWYINADDSHAILTRHRGDGSHELMVDLTLAEPAHTPEGLRFNKALQVTGVYAPPTDEDLGGAGLARSLYAAVARYRQTLIISDVQQYRPGQGLWKSLAENQGHDDVGTLHVYCYSMRNRSFIWCDKSNAPLVYDRYNIPDSQVWSSRLDQIMVLIAQFVE